MNINIIVSKKINGRSAQEIIREFQKSKHRILLKKEDRIVNATSLIGVLSLALEPNDPITIITDEQSDNLADIIKELF